MRIRSLLNINGCIRGLIAATTIVALKVYKAITVVCVSDCSQTLMIV